MDPKYRLIYLLLGFTGLIYLVCQVLFTMSAELNLGLILLIAIPDLVFFYLAYKTYPVESETKRPFIN